MAAIYIGVRNLTDSATGSITFLHYGRGGSQHFSFVYQNIHDLYEVVRLRCQTFGTEEWSARRRCLLQ